MDLKAFRFPNAYVKAYIDVCGFQRINHVNINIVQAMHHGLDHILFILRYNR